MKKIVIIAALILTSTAVYSQKSENLFNGKDLSNWNFVVKDNNVPASEVFTVRDGLIHISGQPFGYMYTKKKYSNFKLHVEWRWPVQQEKSNSGIFLLIEEAKNPFPNGIECQLQEGNAGDFIMLGGSKLMEYQKKPGDEKSPRFPRLNKNNPSSEKPFGEWNAANIFVRDGVITVFINGVYQNMGTNPNREGYVALQSEGKQVEFRNVTISALD